ncbi:MAG: flagellar basal body L-ring protein FlgH [Rhodospirillales bacterium]
MKRRFAFKAACRVGAAVIVLAGVSACNALTRVSEIGSGPKISEITNPVAQPEYRPVSMPMPAPQAVEDNPNSLWRPGARAFFKDHRAKEVGDILTVSLDLNDSATLQNETTRDRNDSEDTNVGKLLGFETQLTAVLPEEVDPDLLFSFDNTHSTNGQGQLERSENIQLQFAAVVTQVLPNGALVVMGRQEVRVNYELRELLVTGIVRPSDINSNNTIEHTKIAEMRVAYGGRGTMSDLQQPRWGTQVWDIVFPF